MKSSPLVLALLLPLLPACPLEEPVDAGPSDAGTQGPAPSTVSGSIQTTVRDEAGALLCEADIEVPARAGFTGYAAVLSDDDETVFTVNFFSQSDPDGPDEAPKAFLQIVGRSSSDKAVEPRDDAVFAVELADLTEITAVFTCEEELEATVGGVGALSTVTAFEASFRGYEGPARVVATPCVNSELSAPCGLTEGSARWSGAVDFPFEGGAVEVRWDLEGETLWGVGSED